jgi:hypothetical protein
MHNVTTALKVLGVDFSLAGNSTTQMESMAQKFLYWVDCLCSKPLARRDAWLSFSMQLLVRISWGLVTVCMHPRKLDTMIQRLYARALPFLGILCKIKKEWRTLPEMFQGLALPNFLLIALSEQILFLLGNWGFHGLAHSKSLAMAYENFLLEVGLYSDPLFWSFEDYGHLSTEATWFQHLWLLVRMFNVSLLIHEDFQIQGVCDGDRSLMSEFF